MASRPFDRFAAERIIQGCSLGMSVRQALAMARVSRVDFNAWCRTQVVFDYRVDQAIAKAAANRRAKDETRKARRVTPLSNLQRRLASEAERLQQYVDECLLKVVRSHFFTLRKDGSRRCAHCNKRKAQAAETSCQLSVGPYKTARRDWIAEIEKRG